MLNNIRWVTCAIALGALAACATPALPVLPAATTAATLANATPTLQPAPAQINSTATPAPVSVKPTASSGLLRDKIKHVVVIMQENRSLDHYFGTYPGADGIPMQNGVPTICVPNPSTRSCVKPYHDPSDKNFGGPHGAANATADIDGGKMDGFIAQEEQGRKNACANAFDPACSQTQGKPDVMGWHDAREIPNYWAYAQNFVLQDRMFEPNASWSLPEHLFISTVVF